MKVLVIGSGGREHALAWKLRQGPRVREVLCAPGNGGIQDHARCIPVSPSDLNGLTGLVRHERVDLVVVGPEAPLAAGMVDHFENQGIPVIGPSRSAARLESSKVFAKEFMLRHGIPTARFEVFSDPKSALARLDSSETDYPLVVKADGLAAGKGVVVAQRREEAREAVERIMIGREFGEAGDRVVIEECLEGREASFIVVTDGTTVIPAVAAQDHKAAYDGDRGPNTGGMGAFSTDSILDSDLQEQVMETIVRPAILGMKSEGCPFTGVLYAGLMLTAEGPKVLEFNARLGDPETQVILPRLDSDLTSMFEALTEGRLREYRASWKPSAAVCVVLASGGYPGTYKKGMVISGLEMAREDPRIVVFHSGTRRENGRFLTDGGRVLGVTALAEDLPAAVMSAYETVNKIRFAGMHYRRDIGSAGGIFEANGGGPA